ncbi:MAG: hypothetical protein CVU30_06085 [Betaproteobacteria bacterium HGW-Betaproteobacteria-3]|nr:MAG: hypothetical protein CVU30_06085 [Betaproteobacteria bacterium HGW-Betaproteobacteria-3]
MGKPVFYLLAGPNGAGKSTLYRALVLAGTIPVAAEFVNADLHPGRFKFKVAFCNLKRGRSYLRPYTTSSPINHTEPAASSLATMASICSAVLSLPSSAPICRKNGFTF